jgi:MOSC domain-containing protein YiiM
MITCRKATCPGIQQPPGRLRSTIAQYNAVSVGVYASVASGGAIRRGDPVTLT